MNATAPWSGAPQRSTDPGYWNKKVGALSKQDAWNMLVQRRSAGERGKDPIHLALEKDWFLNVVHYLGLQRIDNTDLLQDVDPNFLPVQGGFTANHIQRIVRQDVSRLSKARPDMSVTPRTADDSDRMAAKVAESWLDYLHDEHKFRALRRKEAFWRSTCGTAFIHTEWDKGLGQPRESFTNPFNDQPVSPDRLGDGQKEFLRKQGSSKAWSTGGLRVDILAPFQVYVPNTFMDLKDCPWVLIEEDWSLERVWNAYGEKIGKSISVGDFETSIDGQYYRRLHTLVNRHGFTMPSTGSDDQQIVRVSSLWIPPSLKMPKGALIRGTRSTMLEHGPHPYAEAGLKMRYPVTRIRYTEVPGRFWGMSLVEHLIGAQRDYNKTRQQLMDLRDVLGTPQWLSPTSAGMGKVIRNEVGDIWQYKAGGGKPELQSAPNVSPMHLAALEHDIQDMQMMSATSDASMGIAPENVRSGVGLRSLQERDQEVISSAIEEGEEAWQEACRKILQIVHKFESVETAIGIHGDFQQSDIAFFTGAAIDGNTNVRIKPGSMAPKSAAATQQTMMDLIQAGALDPAMNPDDKEKVIQSMDIGDNSAMFDEAWLQKRRATMENEMFKNPKQQPGQTSPAYPGVKDFDDHLLHIKQHLLFQLTDSYERLPPERQLAFEGHQAKHQEALAQMAQMQAAMQEPMGGGSQPAPVGEASQPAEKNAAPGAEAIEA